MSKPHIALLMIVKNEEKRLSVTLNSVLGFVNSLIIFDTHSTDSTITLLKNFSEKHSIPLRLLEGEFEDFSKSRNKSLEFADTFMDVDLLLMMDCNDELRNGKKLLEIAPKLVASPQSAWMVCQHWYFGREHKHHNIRLIKPRCGWFYVGVVHEYIKNKNDIISIEKISDIVIYQDRTQDDDKSAKRFTRDYDLLLTEHTKDPTEPRTVFYLAQTCACLSKFDEAFKYYEIRSRMGNGFYEEVYVSLYNCGKISKNNLGMPWEVSLAYFMKALTILSRAECYYEIASYYRDKQWCLSYHFAKMACEQSYPTDCHLWIDEDIYNYERYSLLGIVAFYYNKFEDGIEACKKAIMTKNLQIDKNNLEIYLTVIQEQLKTQTKVNESEKAKRKRR